MNRLRFVLCVCGGNCPGFSNLNIWDFVNRVRNELPVEYAIVHSMLCDEDGDRFLADYLKKGNKYIVAGCKPNMQKKLFKDAFSKAGLDIEKDLISIDVRMMGTDKAVEIVKSAIEEGK